MADASFLHTEALSVGYGTSVVLDGVEVSLSPGEILTVIAPNGMGKSTLLKTMIRQLPALSGAVFLDGLSLTSYPERELAKKSAAVLTGKPEPEKMTCEEVVSAGRYPYTGRLGILSPEDILAVEEAMRLVRVLPLRDRDFNCLSDGQRQRVLLARAIAQDPKLLVMDEPTSFLDIRHKLEFLHLLKKLVREKQIAAVLSMHELDLAQKFSDTVLCLRDGHVDRFGPPEEIFTGGYIEQLFQVEYGSYDTRFGSLEPPPVSGPPRIFVIAGGGEGIPIYRTLHRKGIPFATGVLHENDLDYPVASALASVVISERAFEPIGEEAFEKAKAVMLSCRQVICPLQHFGSVNRRNEALLTLARENNLIME